MLARPNRCRWSSYYCTAPQFEYRSRLTPANSCLHFVAARLNATYTCPNRLSGTIDRCGRYICHRLAWRQKYKRRLRLGLNEARFRGISIHAASCQHLHRVYPSYMKVRRALTGCALGGRCDPVGGAFSRVCSGVDPKYAFPTDRCPFLQGPHS